MDLIFALILSFTLLLISAFQGYFIAYPLFAAMVIFIAVLMRRGFSLKSLLEMAFRGSQKSFSVLNILLMIGIVTAVWMAAGTVPAIVYYGTQLIHPQYFILATFILTSFVSLLLGTSFGTVSTVGIALMIMAKGSGVNSDLVAGTIIAGAYVGDRCSPMSSSANLIATVTQTKLYTNIQNMWKTALFPLFISAIAYSVLSVFNPVQIADQTFTTELSRVFNIHYLDLLPAIAILLLAILQIEVKLSMLISVIVASAIALFYQEYSLFDLLKFALIGFHLDKSTSLQTIVLGGGLLSMVKVSIVVLISTAFVGIFAETQALKGIERLLERGRWLDAKQFPLRGRGNRFLNTCVVGIATAAFGCTQTIAILLTQQLVQKKYKTEKENYELALDLENTVVVMAPLIPWNIAGLVPATILNTDAGFIPFAIYLYLLPLLNLIHIRLSTPPKLSLCN